MAKFEIVMPKLGESITEATITKWLKNEGEKVSEDEAIAEIATDKVDSEIPSPVEGVIEKFLFQEGDVVEVDKVIVIIDLKEDDGSGEKTQEVAKKDKNKEPIAIPAAEKTKASKEESTEVKTIPLSHSSSGRFYSPLVKNIAKEENIGMEELEKIEATGKDNRLTKEDILKYLKTRKEGKLPQGTREIEKSGAKTTLPKAQAKQGDEIIEMTRMRKLIVDHMVASKDTSVHVTSVIEIDVTTLVKWREEHKKSFEKREGEKLTFTPIFIWAIAKTLKDYPLVNSSVGENKIIIRKDINIGMATALPDGNLIVPVIKNADHKSLLGLVNSVNDLANRARNNKLKPDEIQDGTFTLTNLGSFDTIFATPVINQPQVAILATGVIKKKPVVIEMEQGDTIAIRSMMYLSMSYDHRIIDGALGGMALRRMGEYLQNWDPGISL